MVPLTSSEFIIIYWSETVTLRGLRLEECFAARVWGVMIGGRALKVATGLELLQFWAEIILEISDFFILMIL